MKPVKAWAVFDETDQIQFEGIAHTEHKAWLAFAYELSNPNKYDKCIHDWKNSGYTCRQIEIHY